MIGKIRIVMADDHTLVRRSIATLLRTTPDIDVVSDVDNTDAAIDAAIANQPDVVLMDIDIPGVECFEAGRTIRARCPRTKLIFLSAFTNDTYIEAGIAAGAMGYVTKSEPPDAVINAIRSVAQGRSYFSPEVQARIVIDRDGPTLASAKSRGSKLTLREMEVLRYIARGLSKKDIAKLMHLSVKTIENHTANIMARLDIHDRVDLTRYAIREGIIEP